jgi:hypothetical protein
MHAFRLLLLGATIVLVSCTSGNPNSECECTVWPFPPQCDSQCLKTEAVIQAVHPDSHYDSGAIESRQTGGGANYISQ